MSPIIPKIGGSACKYIKKSKQCITPCKIVHNNKVNHKWYCKKTKRCSGRKRHHKKKSSSTKKSSSSSTKKSSSSSSKKSYPKKEVEEKKEEEEVVEPTSFTSTAKNTISSITETAKNIFGETKPETTINKTT